MINSPSLSVVPATSKASKTPSFSEESSARDFGSVLDAANRTSSVDRSTNTHVSGTDKKQTKQSVNDDSPASNERAVESEAAPQSSRQQNSVTAPEDKAPTEGDQTSVAEERASSENASAEPSIPSDEDGKERQADGQALAVDPALLSLPVAEQTDVTRLDAMAETESITLTNSEASSDESEAVLAAESGEEAEASLTSSLVPGAVTESEMALAESSSQEGANEALDESELDGVVSDAITGGAVNESAQYDKAVSSTDEVDASTLVDGVRLSNDAGEPLVNDQKVLDATSAAAADESEGVEQPILAAVAQLTSTTSADSKAADTVSLESTRTSDNLRWVMEQLSKTNAPTASANGAMNAAQTAEGALVGETLASVLEEGDLSTFLDKETIELPKDLTELLGNKKALEPMMSGFGSALQGASQPINGFSGAMLAAAGTAQNARPDGATAQLTMHFMPDTQAWSSEMASKVSWVAKEGFKTAHIQLDPPELGSLTVKVSIDQDSNTQVSFVASSTQAKEALESQMQRLRDMLQQQGIDLDSVDVEVSQDNGQAYGSDASEGENGTGSGAGNAANGDGDAMDDLENVSYVLPAEQGIDYYA